MIVISKGNPFVEVVLIQMANAGLVQAQPAFVVDGTPEIEGAVERIATAAGCQVLLRGGGNPAQLEKLYSYPQKPE